MRITSVKTTSAVMSSSVLEEFLLAGSVVVEAVSDVVIAV